MHLASDSSTIAASMRVLHVISGLDLSSGGPVTVISGLTRAQKAAGMEVHVVSTFCRGHDLALAAALEHDEIGVTLIGPAVGPLLSYHPKTRRTLAKLIPQFDVVHIHSCWEDIQHQAARLCQRFQVPYVFTPHGMLDVWSLTQKSLKKRAYMRLRLRRDLQNASIIHLTTQAEYDGVRQLGLRPPHLIDGLGLDLNEFAQLPPQGQLRKRFPQLGNRPIVLFLGRINYKKGLDILIPAFAQAIGRDLPVGRDAMLVVAGPDHEGYSATLLQLAKQHGVEDRLIFAGMLRGRERLEAFVDASFFALPSYQENFGIAVAEALAANCPVLISDQVQIHHEIGAAHVGQVTPVDIGKVADAIANWLGNPSSRDEYAARARKFAFHQYDWMKVAQRWKQHYARLTPHPADAPQPRQVRILHIISDLDPKAGGPVSALVGLTAAQAKQGLDVTVISTFHKVARPESVIQIETNGVLVHMIGPTWQKLRWRWGMAALLRPFIKRADVIHIHAVWEEIQHQAAVVARELGKPYIIRPCGMLDPWSLAQNATQKKVYLSLRLKNDLDAATAIHCTSITEGDLLAPLSLAAPVVVEPNGITLDEFRTLPPRGTFRNDYPQVGKRPMVLFLSRIHRKKGLDILLPAFAQTLIEFQKNAPDDLRPILVIAGPDSDGYQAKLITETQRLGILEDVLFTGPLFGARKLAAYADADLFCLPSYQKSFENVVIESLAAGTPVLISDQVNISREIVAAGMGEAFPVDIQQCAAALTRWLLDADLRQKASVASREFAFRHYDWEKIAAAWTEQYQSFASATENPPKPPPSIGWASIRNIISRNGL